MQFTIPTIPSRTIESDGFVDAIVAREGDAHACECTTRYVTRFGDVCCVEHDFPIAWAPALVREGVYGDVTSVWTFARMDAVTSVWHRNVTLCAHTMRDTRECECYVTDPASPLYER